MEIYLCHRRKLILNCKLCPLITSGIVTPWEELRISNAELSASSPIYNFPVTWRETVTVKLRSSAPLSGIYWLTLTDITKLAT